MTFQIGTPLGANINVVHIENRSTLISLMDGIKEHAYLQKKRLAHDIWRIGRSYFAET